jgi:hypothetical protein
MTYLKHAWDSPWTTALLWFVAGFTFARYYYGG